MGGLANPLLALDLQLGQPLPRRRDPRLEFRLLEQPVAVSIDQSRNHFFTLLISFLICSTSRLGPASSPCSRRSYSARTRSGSDKRWHTSSQTAASSTSVR